MLSGLAVAFVVFGSVLPVLIAAVMCGFCSKKSKPSGVAYSSSHHEATDHGLSQPLALNAQSVRAKALNTFVPVYKLLILFLNTISCLVFEMVSCDWS
jgi:hypothetical protein